jgi:hypothetical protein
MRLTDHLLDANRTQPVGQGPVRLVAPATLAGLWRRLAEQVHQPLTRNW